MDAPATRSIPTLRSFFVLGRVSNLPTVWTNVAVGWFLSGGAWTADFGWLLLGMSLIYVAGMTLNDAFDAKWDKEHAPERPIPSGQIRRGIVWITGLLQMMTGVGVILALTIAWPSLLLGLVLAILLYNALHKRWSGSVLIMGMCRALVYILAGSAVATQTEDFQVPSGVLVIAGLSVLYIAGLTLAARSERLASPGRLRMFPRLMLMLPALFPFVAARTAPSELPYHALLVLAVVGITAWISIVRRSLAERIPKGIAFALAGIAFYDAGALGFADIQAAIAALICFVLTLGLQKIVPAT